jgi:hypothetical protein
MKPLLFAIALIFSIYSCKPGASKGDDLTPELAAAQISEHYKGQVVYETFPLTQGGAFTEAVRTKFVELQNGGLITFTEAPYGDGTIEFTATLTDKGKQYVLEDRGQEVIVKHADMTLGDIRSIAPAPDGQSAIVKYTFKRYNVTPFGALNGMQDDVMEAEDTFVRFGDTWKLQNAYIPRRFD